MLRLPGIDRKSTSSEEGIGFSPASDGSGPMKVTVKNTFIEMMPEKAEQRVAQSCTARLSDPSPNLFSNDPTPKSNAGSSETPTATGGNSYTVPEWTSETRSHASESSGSREWTTSVKNTFIEIHDELESPINCDRMAQSCVARLSASAPNFALDGISEDGQFTAPPTGYLLEQSSTGPPPAPTWAPALSPDAPEFRMSVKNTFIDFRDQGNPHLSDGDRYIGGSCMARLSDPASGFMTPARQEHVTADSALLFPQTPQTVGGVMSHGLATYADMDGQSKALLLTKPRSPVDDVESACPTGDSQTPTAVPLVPRSPQNPPVPPPMYEAPSGLTNLSDHNTPPPPCGPPLHAAGQKSQKDELPSKITEGIRRISEASTEEAEWPSLGSQLHGTVGDDGTPACKPCAWFYKEGSCLNAKGCGYCHLCPQGELKNRKKTKIALLRKAEAGSSPTAKSTASTSPKADAPTGIDQKTGQKVFLLSSHLPGSS